MAEITHPYKTSEQQRKRCENKDSPQVGKKKLQHWEAGTVIRRKQQKKKQKSTPNVRNKQQERAKRGVLSLSLFLPFLSSVFFFQFLSIDA
jgi:hypothetical protein